MVTIYPKLLTSKFPEGLNHWGGACVSDKDYIKQILIWSGFGTLPQDLLLEEYELTPFHGIMLISIIKLYISFTPVKPSFLQTFHTISF